MTVQDRDGQDKNLAVFIAEHAHPYDPTTAAYHRLGAYQIAKRLFLTEGTVKNYVTNILGKIGARDRTQAALRARELGIR